MIDTIIHSHISTHTHTHARPALHDYTQQGGRTAPEKRSGSSGSYAPVSAHGLAHGRVSSSHSSNGLRRGGGERLTRRGGERGTRRCGERCARRCGERGTRGGGGCGGCGVARTAGSAFGHALSPPTDAPWCCSSRTNGFPTT